MNEIIPILSLTIALLAVFVGPFISWRIAKRQIDSSQRISNKQIIAPIRQAWINELRNYLSEIISSSHHYFVAGFEDRTDEEYKRLTELEHRITLMLNPNEEDNENLLKVMRDMMNSINGGKEYDDQFIQSQSKITELSQRILKKEWIRVKEEV